jgi:hypothetical protein
MRLRILNSVKILALTSLLAGVVHSARCVARPPEEAEFVAVSHLGAEIASWLGDLGEKKPKSVGIFYVHANAPLGQDFAGVAETEILKQLLQKGFEKVVSCTECRNPIVTVTDDKIVVSRATIDAESMKKFSKTQSVQTFLLIELYRTKLNLLAQASLYENPTGTLIAAEKFEVPALNFSDTSVQIMFLAGGGKSFQGKGVSQSTLGTQANLMLLEELGFAKGGLTIGGIFGVGGSYIAYLNPTLSFQGRFGNSAMSWGINLGVGYGLASASKGFTSRVGLELILGNFTVLGLEGTYFFPETSTADVIKSYGGIHLGIALGR